MTEKELRKLNRYQLLELLIMQTEQNDMLKKQVEELTAKLRDRQVKMETLGSVAEAALQLNGVFEAAQRAADDYLDAARRQAEKILQQAKVQAEQTNGEDHEA